MPFGNPIIAGSGVLLRTDIQSETYVPGVTGWRIARDGTSEFLSATITGSITALGGLIVLDVTGIWTKASDGSYVRLYTDGSGSYALVNPADDPGHVVVPGQLRGSYYAAHTPQVLITSPVIDAGPSSSIALTASSGGCSARISGNDVSIIGATDNITVGIAGGITAYVGSTSRTITLSGMVARTYPVKTAGTTRVNSAVLTDDPHLKFYALANSRYECRLRVTYTAAAAAGFKCDFTAPAGASFETSHFITVVSGATTYALTNPLGAISGMTGTGAGVPLEIRFSCVTGADAGDVTWRWAQNVANASNYTVDSGGILTVEKVG
jgi:hypothetical protein